MDVEEAVTSERPNAEMPFTGTGRDLRDALREASLALEGESVRVDALNVFPVPDGDTGTNMSLTLRAVREAIASLPDSAPVGEVVATAARAAMIGARGNSGVILSQLLRGLSEALRGHETIGPADLARGIVAASDAAYRSVSRPVEGTILTVARCVGEAAESAAKRGDELVAVLAAAAESARAAVAATPSQLEVLRKAGVVDSGGEGYRIILEAMWRSAARLPRIGPLLAHQHAQSPVDAAAQAEETPFGFCTEFLLQDVQADVADIRAAMERLGESVIAVGNRELVRVHVHTMRPGLALEYAVDHGTVAQVKVENMTLQHQAHVEAHRQSLSQEASGESVTPSSGVIAVVPGEGLQEVFRSLGAYVVEGGQSMNPSVQDFLDALRHIGFRDTILLPNNSNVIATAQLVGELTDQVVEVVPTETVPQGIAALLAFNFQADHSTNASAMNEAAQAVTTIEVARAVRDADVEGIHVREGQVMGLLDGVVVSAAPDLLEAALAALRRLDGRMLEIVTIYVGRDGTFEDAELLADRIRAERSGVGVEIHRGGQPHYPLLLSLE